MPLWGGLRAMWLNAGPRHSDTERGRQLASLAIDWKGVGVDSRSIEDVFELSGRLNEKLLLGLPADWCQESDDPHLEPSIPSELTLTRITNSDAG